MPITEIPPSHPSSSTPPPEPPLGKRAARYKELEPEELFHVIDDLEGSKARGRIREFIYVSIILHMMLFWYLAYGPRYFQHVRVVNPSDILKQREKEITSLELSDAIKKLKSEAKSLPKAHKPTIDQKTLEAIRKAEPKIQPPPTPQPQPEQAPPPQVAQQTPPPPQPQPAPQPPQNSQLSSLEAPKPKPAPTVPNFNTGPSTPGDEIRQAARAAAQAPPTFGGEIGNGKNGPTSSGGVQILSDTMGVNFDPYMRRIVYDTERAWWPIIPEVARPPLNKAGRVMIRFKILKDGSVKEMTLEGPSGDVSLDRAAWAGITGASPFPKLPTEFKGPYLELRFYFLYNIKPGDE